MGKRARLRRILTFRLSHLFNLLSLDNQLALSYSLLKMIFRKRIDSRKNPAHYRRRYRPNF